MVAAAWQLYLLKIRPEPNRSKVKGDMTRPQLNPDRTAGIYMALFIEPWTVGEGEALACAMSMCLQISSAERPAP
jgi:hypothetical protein